MTNCSTPIVNLLSRRFLRMKTADQDAGPSNKVAESEEEGIPRRPSSRENTSAQVLQQQWGSKSASKWSTLLATKKCPSIEVIAVKSNSMRISRRLLSWRKEGETCSLEVERQASPCLRTPCSTSRTKKSNSFSRKHQPKKNLAVSCCLRLTS